jgi:hypothetical protein
MTEGDELLEMIREIVAHHGIAPAQRAIITDTTARVCIAVMTQPHFYERLKIVLALRQENDLLRQQLAQLSAVIYRSNLKPSVKKRPAKKRAPAKKAVARSPKVTVKSATKAFKKGASGR